MAGAYIYIYICYVNYPEINWENLKAANKGREFVNLVPDGFLVQHVVVPTRGNNVLDLVLSSDVGMLKISKYVSTFLTVIITC